MAEPVRIIGGNVKENGIQVSNEQLQAQVDTSHNLQVREGTVDKTNKTYEDTSFVVGDSPAVHDFFGDTARNSVDGYIICDGTGNISVDISRDGLTYDSAWTMKKGEVAILDHLTISKIRVTHSGTDSAYRINLI